MSDDEKDELYYALDQAATGLRKRHGQSLFKLIEKITETDKDADKEKRKLVERILGLKKAQRIGLIAKRKKASHIEEAAKRAERAAERLPQKPRPPLGAIIRDPDRRLRKCPECGSSLELKWLFFIKNGGCINPPCERYHENAIRMSDGFRFARKRVKPTGVRLPE